MPLALLFTMHSMRWRLTLAIVLVAVPAPALAQPVFDQLRVIAPAAPGGGWDQTARVMQQVLLRAGIARTVPVENIAGAAGTIGLARVVSAERGNREVVMVSGLIMLAAIVTHRSPVTLHDVTPIARITGEYEVIVVPAASPFRSLQELVQAFKAHPESISWGGGSAGGTDQILAGLVSDAAGVAPTRVNYIAFSGGGEAMSAILGGQVSVGINGLAEFQAQIDARTVRVLGISSAERLPGLDAPTLREQGVNVELENWRSIVAPPGISTGDRDRAAKAIEAMVRSGEWRAALERYRWLDRYLAGAAFDRFVETEEARVRGILSKLGLDGATTTTVPAAAYPAFVLGGLFVTGLAAVLTIWSRTRGRRADHEGSHWRPVALVAAGVILDLAFIEYLGFVLASAALFWFTARAFDSAHPVRDAMFAIGISVSSYLLFARVLQLQLPAGLLAGWL